MKKGEKARLVIFFKWLEKTTDRTNENGETKVLHPDFFLPDYNVYIEYCELTNKPYLKKREYTLNVYKQNNKNVIIMSDKDIENRDKFFFDELGIN